MCLCNKMLVHVKMLFGQYWNMRYLFGVLTLLRTSMPSRMYSEEHQDLPKINAKDICPMKTDANC